MRTEDVIVTYQQNPSVISVAGGLALTALIFLLLSGILALYTVIVGDYPSRRNPIPWRIAALVSLGLSTILFVSAIWTQVVTGNG